MEIPFCAATDRNKEAVGDALATPLAEATSVLEIGSGSGQHAIYLCQRYSHLQWQVTEQGSRIEGLSAAVAESGCENIKPPFELEVSTYSAAVNKSYSLVFSANTAHIMSIDEVKLTFNIVNRSLSDDGLFALYGPFKENGQHNSEGNSTFDQALQSEDPKMGIRDIAELKEIAGANKLKLLDQLEMPANNRILLWQKA